jgi:phytoene desaturase
MRLSTPITRIEVEAGSRRATGVRTASGDVLDADIIVSNADVASTYLDLIDARARPRNSDRRIRSLRYSMSLFVLYFGTDRRYDDIAHHEILMGPRYEALLAEIFGQRPLPSDFSLYLHRPTATDSSLAPPGGDAFYVLSPVAHLGAPTDWETAARPYRDAIVQHLETRYLPNLSKHIVTERIVDPRYFRDALGSHLGSAFSVEPVLTQSAWFRPHNRSEDIENLYFAGAGTHPGAGVPGVMSSGKIVADMIGPATRPASRTHAVVTAAAMDQSP